MTNISLEAIRTNQTLAFPVQKSNKSKVSGKLRYWWSWFIAGSMLILVGAPALLILWAVNRRESLYPLSKWGAKNWLRASGAHVTVKGRVNLEPGRSYVFASNHRSYLDTAALFFYTGTKMGLVAKKELLKVPIFGQGMSFVNIIAIDRSNPEMALSSMNKAREVMSRGYSFGVFVEGTRAMPGELLPFKKGAFHLAMQTGSPIVPVAFRNTDWMMGKRTGVAFAGEVEMILLAPVETDGKGPSDIPAILAETRHAIAAELAKG